MKARPWIAFDARQVQRNYCRRRSLVTRRISNKALTETASRAITIGGNTKELREQRGPSYISQMARFIRVI